MKKSYIIMAVLLLASVAGTYVVFAKYVLPMQQELAAHQEEAVVLKTTIDRLAETFDETMPEVVIRTWQEGKQPWVNGSNARTGYFKTEDIGEIEIPEGVIPRFWYIEEFPKLEDSLYESAAEKRIVLGNINFDIHKPSFYDGKNPTAEEILVEINKYNYGIAMTELIFEANPTHVNEVNIWPTKSLPKGKSGELFKRTIGYSLEIQYEELLKFLQQLNRSDKYITVEGIKITKKDLKSSRESLHVELLITDANFVPNKATGTTPGVGEADPGAAGRFSNMLGNMRRRTAEPEEEEEETGGFLSSTINFFKGLFK